MRNALALLPVLAAILVFAGLALAVLLALNPLPLEAERRRIEKALDEEERRSVLVPFPPSPEELKAAQERLRYRAPAEPETSSTVQTRGTSAFLDPDKP